MDQNGRLAWGVAAILAICLVLAGMAVTHSRLVACKYERPRVQSQEEPHSRLKGEKPSKSVQGETADGLSASGQTVSRLPGRETEEAAEQCDEEGSETFPLLFGFRLKITDALLVILTGFLALYTRELNRSTLKLWEAGEDQKKITNEIFVATQRPWLSGQFEIAGDLTYRDERVGFGIKYVLSNHGNTVARKVYVRSKLTVERLEKPVFIDGYQVIGPLIRDTGKDLREFCEHAIDEDIRFRAGGRDDGINVFPNEPQRGSSYPDGNVPLRAKGVEYEGAIIGNPIILICITYYFPFDDKPRHTGYRLYLFGKEPNKDIGDEAILMDRGTIPQDRLYMHRTYFPSEDAS